MIYGFSDNKDKKEVYSKDETYSKKEVYSKGETFSRDEVYLKGETYSKDEVYSKNEVDSKIQKTILYEDETGTTGNVTLSDSAENYDYLEIYYKKGVRSGSIKVSDFTDKMLVLPIIVVGSASLIMANKQISVVGSTITKDSEYQYTLTLVSGGKFSETDDIYIYKVIGYKS